MDATSEIALYAAVGDAVNGPILVSSDGFSPRYDLDRTAGLISRNGHDLYGESLAGKIVIFDHAKGGVAAGWAMLDIKSRGFAPAALVFRVINPVFVQGCVLAGITIASLDRTSEVPLQRAHHSGTVDPVHKTLKIHQLGS